MHPVSVRAFGAVGAIRAAEFWQGYIVLDYLPCRGLLHY